MKIPGKDDTRGFWESYGGMGSGRKCASQVPAGAAGCLLALSQLGRAMGTGGDLRGAGPSVLNSLQVKVRKVGGAWSGDQV